MLWVLIVKVLTENRIINNQKFRTEMQVTQVFGVKDRVILTQKFTPPNKDQVSTQDQDLQELVKVPKMHRLLDSLKRGNLNTRRKET